MYLKNIKIRVKKYPQGYAVEIEQTKHFLLSKKKYWTHLISVSGMNDRPWYYKTEENAIEEAKKLFEWDLLIGSREYC